MQGWSSASGRRCHFNLHQTNAVPLNEVAASSPVQSHISTFAWQDDMGSHMSRDLMAPPITSSRMASLSIFRVEPCGLKLKRNWKCLFLVHAARIRMVSCRGCGRPNKAAVRIIAHTALSFIDFMTEHLGTSVGNISSGDSGVATVSSSV
jgi:hypothetical protein